MKKIIMMCSVVAILCGMSVYAEEKKEMLEVSTVSQVETMANKSPVMLEGSVIRKIKKNRYTFRDDSGSIEVIVDDHIWQGAEIRQTAKLRLTGQVKCIFGMYGRKVIVEKVVMLKKGS